MSKATGRLAHHFWNPYCATIVLDFGTAANAQEAAKLFPGWKVAKTHAQVLRFHGDDKTGLAETLALLESFGADPKKVSSLRYSIDYGEAFEIDTTPATSRGDRTLDEHLTSLSTEANAQEETPCQN